MIPPPKQVPLEPHCPAVAAQRKSCCAAACSIQSLPLHVSVIYNSGLECTCQLRSVSSVSVTASARPPWLVPLLHLDSLLREARFAEAVLSPPPALLSAVCMCWGMSSQESTAMLI
jgi:hypothetical protein